MTSSSATLYSTTRGYDAVGNVISEDTALGTGTTTDNQLFCYDEQNRLTWAGATGTSPCNGAVSSGSLTTAYYTQTYGYDAQGRLTSAALGSYTYGDPNHPHAVTAIGSGGAAYGATYDAAGDLTCRAPSSSVTCSGISTGQTLTYDAERRLAHWQNQPSSPTAQADYLYDGAGQRVEQSVTTGGTTITTAYLLGGVEEVSGGVVTKYLGAKGLPTAVRVGTTGSLNYLATDGLNSVSVAVDGSGNLVASQLYAPYGTARYASGTMPTSKGFTGQRADATTGLDYYGARYYDPLAGQFTSADSVSQGLSRYAYVGGNPETATDPSGHLITKGPGGGGNPYRAPNPYPVTGFNFSANTDSCYPIGCFKPGDHSNNYWKQHREEKQDGDVVASYFGVHVTYEQQLVIGANGEWHHPDYNVFVQYQLSAPEVGDFTETGAIYNMDLITPDNSNWTGKNPNYPSGIVGSIIQKGAEGNSIVIVDLRNADPAGQLTQSELNSYAALAVYSPYKSTYPSHVARVIFINDGQVVDDFNPLAYGPSPADKSQPQIVQN